MVRNGALLIALAVLACARHEAPRGAGRRVLDGEALALRASSDGTYLALLRDCRPLKDRMLPSGTSRCELWVVATSGGPSVRVAPGVTTFGHGFAWSRTGHLLAALGEHDPAEGRGTLFLWSGAEPRRLATDVSFYGFDRTGTALGWVSAGQLFVTRTDGGPATPVAGADGVSTFDFGGKDAIWMLARRSSRAGGALLAVRDHASWPLARDVRDYGFGADGERIAFTAGVSQELAVVQASTTTAAAGALGRDVQSFLFAPRGRAVAFIADAVPGRQGDLWVSAPESRPVRLAQRVGEPRWASDGAHLAWLQDYDPRSRTGTITVGGVGLPPRTLSRNVSDFDLTPDAAAIAYLVHETAGGYSVNLGVARLADAAPPVTVARGVFGFAFSPDGRWLYYRTACIREAEACDLYRISVGGAAAGGKGERIAEGVKSFEFAPGRPERLLVSWARKDRIALDLAVWDAGKLTAVDTSAVPGTAQFLGGDPTRLAYVVNDPKRSGVYVAHVP